MQIGERFLWPFAKANVVVKLRHLATKLFAPWGLSEVSRDDRKIIGLTEEAYSPV